MSLSGKIGIKIVMNKGYSVLLIAEMKMHDELNGGVIAQSGSYRRVERGSGRSITLKAVPALILGAVHSDIGALH